MLIYEKPQKIDKENLEFSGIPRRYWENNNILSLTRDNKEKAIARSVSKYILNIEEMKKEGIGILIFSDSSLSGKTTLATFIGKCFLSYGAWVSYKTFDTMIDIGRKEKSFSYDEKQNLGIYDSDLLIVDNIKKIEKREIQFLEKVIIARQDKLFPTIMVLQDSKIEKLGSEIYKIVKNYFIKLDMTGISFESKSKSIMRKIIC